eukprot:3174626-Alexandrium_andersonii.AAC.1
MGPRAAGTGAPGPTLSAGRVGRSTTSAAWTSSSGPERPSRASARPTGGQCPTSRHHQSTTLAPGPTRCQPGPRA